MRRERPIPTFRAIAASPVAVTAQSAAPARLVAQSSGGRGAQRTRPTGQIRTGRKRGHALRVLLLTQPGLFADAFARSLETLADEVEVVRIGASEATHCSRKGDLVLVDLDGLGLEAIATVRALRAQVVGPLVALTATFDPLLMGSILSAGAAAFLVKSYNESQALHMLLKVLERSSTDRSPLSPSSLGLDAADSHSARSVQPAFGRRRASTRNPYRLTDAELSILALVCGGLSNLAICKRRAIKEGTVKGQLHNIYRKLGVQSRTQAVRIGERLDAIRELQLLHAADTRTVFDWLLPHVSSESRRAGEVLFQRGDPGDSLYFVQQGRVQLAEIGVEVGAGELLGEVGLFSPQHARTCTARCTMDTRLFRLNREQARRLYFENPQFAYHLMQLIAGRLTVERERL